MKLLDLEKLEALEKAATPGKWSYATCYGVATIESPGYDDVAHAVKYLETEDADLICELRNAAPQLIAEAKAARAWLACVYNNANSPKEEKAWAADADEACVTFKRLVDQHGGL